MDDSKKGIAEPYGSKSTTSKNFLSALFWFIRSTASSAYATKQKSQKLNHILTFILRVINLIEFHILPDELDSFWIPIISHQILDVVNLFEIPHRSQSRCRQCLQYIYSFFIKYFTFGFSFLAYDLDIFSYDGKTNISIEFLDRIVEYCASSLVDFIGLALSTPTGFDIAFRVPLQFLLNVEDFCLPFF